MNSQTNLVNKTYNTYSSTVFDLVRDRSYLGVDLNILKIIINFLDQEDIINLSLTSKLLRNSLQDKIFDYECAKIPVIQSNIHPFGSKCSSRRYKWNRINFTIEEKAKINISLLDRLESYEQVRYGSSCVIFTLNTNGLMCQLPSSNHTIKKYDSNDVNKEYAFIRVFKLNPKVLVYSDQEELLEYKSNNLYYVSIKIVFNEKNTSLDNLPELSELKKVIQYMESYYQNREGKAFIKYK